jgi:hypothetical protein
MQQQSQRRRMVTSSAIEPVKARTGRRMATTMPCASRSRRSERKRSAVAVLKASVAYYASLGVTVERVVIGNRSCYRSFAFPQRLPHRSRPHPGRASRRAAGACRPCSGSFLDSTLREVPVDPAWLLPSVTPIRGVPRRSQNWLFAGSTCIPRRPTAVSDRTFGQSIDCWTGCSPSSRNC